MFHAVVTFVSSAYFIMVFEQWAYTQSYVKRDWRGGLSTQLVQSVSVGERCVPNLTAWRLFVRKSSIHLQMGWLRSPKCLVTSLLGITLLKVEL